MYCEAAAVNVNGIEFTTFSLKGQEVENLLQMFTFSSFTRLPIQQCISLMSDKQKWNVGRMNRTVINLVK